MTMRATNVAYFAGVGNVPADAIAHAQNLVLDNTDKNERVISWSVALTEKKLEAGSLWTAFACVVFEVEEKYPNG